VADVDPSAEVSPTRAGRRGRRRATAASDSPAPDAVPVDPQAMMLEALTALRASNEALCGEVRELRRRITALSSKVELLDQRLVEGESTQRLRVPTSKTRRRVSGD